MMIEEGVCVEGREIVFKISCPVSFGPEVVSGQVTGVGDVGSKSATISIMFQYNTVHYSTVDSLAPRSRLRL
eukprot:COSAG03_NODE_835_length_5677_cov_2.833094_3_plen_72_part_00